VELACKLCHLCNGNAAPRCPSSCNRGSGRQDDTHGTSCCETLDVGGGPDGKDRPHRKSTHGNGGNCGRQFAQRSWSGPSGNLGMVENTTPGMECACQPGDGYAWPRAPLRAFSPNYARCGTRRTFPGARPSTSRWATRSPVLHPSGSNPSAASVPLAARMPCPSARSLRANRAQRQAGGTQCHELPGFRPIWGMSFAMIRDTLHFVLVAISWYAALIADSTAAISP